MRRVSGIYQQPPILLVAEVGFQGNDLEVRANSGRVVASTTGRGGKEWKEEREGVERKSQKKDRTLP